MDIQLHFNEEDEEYVLQLGDRIFRLTREEAEFLQDELFVVLG